MDTSAKPDVQINVVAKRWSWDFNYVDSGVYESGVHTELNTDAGGAPQPVLYLPVNKRVEFTPQRPRRRPLVLDPGLPPEARHDPRQDEQAPDRADPDR